MPGRRVGIALAEAERSIKNAAGSECLQDFVNKIGFIRHLELDSRFRGE